MQFSAFTKPTFLTISHLRILSLPIAAQEIRHGN